MSASDEPAYEEEEYDIEEGENDEEFVDAVDSAPVAPAPASNSGGGLFPGAPNPFANWLGAIAGGGSSAPADTTATVTKEEEDLPTPPAPSALPMPKAVDSPGATTTPNNNRPKSKSPRRNRGNKSPRKSRSPKRSQSNKKGGDDKNTNEGKVQILKRDDANVAPPLPADPSILSDPALMAAAGIPIPPNNLSSQPSQQQTSSPAFDPSVLDEQIQKAMEAAMTSIVVPAVEKSVQESFSTTLARPLQKSMNSLSKKGVSVNSDDLKEALDVETPLKEVFASSLKNVIVPSLASITNQIMQQVQVSMPKPPPPNEDSKVLVALVQQQLKAMNTTMDTLTAEVQQLRKTVADQAVAAAAAAAQQNGNGNPAQNHGGAKQGQPEDIRTYIDRFLSMEKYEEAFTKAVAAPTPQLTVYCCARSNLQKVLSGNTPKLSQPILICLMQQLSAALAGTQSPQEMQLEVAWLQELTLVMNPMDPSIAQHVPKVLQQLVANVNARLAAEGIGPFRRPLQMLLNSLMGMQLQLGK